MTDAGEKLEQRIMNYGILAECQESALELVRDELERAAAMLENCADACVDCAQKSVAQYVLRRGASAIRKLKE